jgi:signal transduction histidine kinase
MYPFTIRPPWWKTNLAYVIYMLVFLGSILGIFYWRSAALRRENRILEEKVQHRTLQLQQKSSELELSLDDLKSAQTQLIQSEKLASLGELTAGIAHEIQNPLNFVNNFAEINQELLGELEEEIEKGNLFEIKDLAKNLKINEGKINHHGQRASAIVRAMLEHSRASTGVKELTDLNSLADEYLRLAYHGLRAKDNTIVATIETHFDPELPKIAVIPQDMGRVILNLINNAFYAVTEKAKKGMEGYRPTVTISTKRLKNAIEIRVTDNGNGIPEAIKDKIFQPFFTTKPTGQGTGLGLSLSYDIVTKGHQGSLVVESKIGDGATFVIQLPDQKSS